MIKKYESPNINVVLFSQDDVMATSGLNDFDVLVDFEELLYWIIKMIRRNDYEKKKFC